jgi:LysM repeat protein
MNAISPVGGTYTIKWGDTLSELAHDLGIAFDKLLDANTQIVNRDLIYAGGQLNLPGGAEASGQPANAGSIIPASYHLPTSGGNAAAVAAIYLGQDASDLKVNRRDNLPMDPNVPSNECCANFVSAALIEAGDIPASMHTNRVPDLKEELQRAGWQVVSPQQAKPGDVVIMESGISHTELYAGNGQMIGSNNRNADGTQEITTDSLSYALRHGGVILSKVERSVVV